MGWDQNNQEIAVWADISPQEWKNEIEKQAAENKIKIKVELINVKKRFDAYFAVLNPYGGVYPESDVPASTTLSKILTYVSERGLFVNVADIPGYWAYNQLLKRKLDATRPLYGIERTPEGRISIIPVRPFELTPFMEKLGLRVINAEGTEFFNWNAEVEGKFKGLMKGIAEIKVHRAVICEKNVQQIIKHRSNGQLALTPLFFAPYGGGNFLISLVVLDQQYPQNRIMKELLAKIIVELIKTSS